MEVKRVVSTDAVEIVDASELHLKLVLNIYNTLKATRF